VRQLAFLSLVALLANIGAPHAKELWCTVLRPNGTVVAIVPIKAPDNAENCRALTEAYQHAGVTNASFKMMCRTDEKKWSDSGNNPNSNDATVKGCT
jgi:hypothetical protein